MKDIDWKTIIEIIKFLIVIIEKKLPKANVISEASLKFGLPESVISEIIQKHNLFK